MVKIRQQHDFNVFYESESGQTVSQVETAPSPIIARQQVREDVHKKMGYYPKILKVKLVR